MEGRININVSTVDYDKTSKALTHQLFLLEEMVHGQNDFVMTDSEFAFGWHFFVLSINRSLVEKLIEMMGVDFDKIKGKGNVIDELEKNEAIDKKLLRYLTVRVKKFDLEANYFAKREDDEKKESYKN